MLKYIYIYTHSLPNQPLALALLLPQGLLCVSETCVYMLIFLTFYILFIVSSINSINSLFRIIYCL